MTQKTISPSRADSRRGLPSASAFRRYELCPGSYQLEAKAREIAQAAPDRGPAALRGERIHAWLAGDKEVELSDEELLSAEFLLERANGERARIFGDAQVQELFEERLWLRVGGTLAASGQPDRVLYCDSLALIQDYKTGWSEPTQAEQSSQMKVLAVLVGLALLETHPRLQELIVQIISGPYGVSEARFDLDELSRAYSDICNTIARLHDPAAPLAPSPEACRYCPAILICQAVRDTVIPVINQMAALPEGGVAASRMLDEISVLEARFAQVRKFYSARLEADPSYPLPGYALVPGPVRREITDWTAAARRLSEWLEPDQLALAANYRLGDLEKALGAKLKLKGKALRDSFSQILDGLIEEKVSAPTLKRTSGVPRTKQLTP